MGILKIIRFGIVVSAFFGLGLVFANGVLVIGGCNNATTAPQGTTSAVSANAGVDKDILVGSASTLDGQSSAGVQNASWTIQTKPSGSAATLANDTTLTPSITADVAGTYVVQLSINNGASTDTATLTAKSVVADITVPSGSAVTTRTRFNTTEYVINAGQTGGILSAASSSAAALKTQSTGSFTYQWEQIAGPDATTTNGTTNETLEFTAPSYAEIQNLGNADNYKWQILPISRDDTKMVFRVTKTDSSGGADINTFTVYLQDADGREIHTSSGLPNVPVGLPVILSGPDLLASGASATDPAKEFGKPVTDWSWTLTVPSGSSAKFADSGNTSSTVQFPKFTPDVAGIYLVSYASTSGTNSYTNPTTKCPGTLTINAADWVGVGIVGAASPVAPQCATCHGEAGQSSLKYALSGLEDTVSTWNNTKHASIFEDNVGTYAGLAPEPYLWEFHTVGYNKDGNSTGFDDLASAGSFTFPSAGLAFADFTSQYPSVAKLANVQCENCHGPGSQHDGDPTRIAHSYTQAGTCGQCHQEEAQWGNSGHAFVGVEHGSGNYQQSWISSVGCLRCHNAKGFVTYLEEGEEGIASLVSDASADFPGVTCAACHDPHNATNENQLRQKGSITMAIDGSTVDAGKAAVCYTCHDGNYALGETNCDVDGDGRATTSDDDATGLLGTVDGKCNTFKQTVFGYWRGGMHYVEAGPELEGKGTISDLNNDGTDDYTLSENSFHSSASFTLAGATGNADLPSANNKCVTCHMATGPSPEQEGYGHLGGHAFKLTTGHGIGHLQGTDEGDTLSGEEGDIELTTACTVCHASITEINRRARADYDGDGTVEGIQDETTGLIFALWKLVKVVDTANGANLNQASQTVSESITYNGATATSTASNTVVGPTSSDDTPAGTITLSSMNWKGVCSSLAGPSSATATRTVCNQGITQGGNGSCLTPAVATNRTKDDYQNCNFIEAPAAIRAAVWNLKWLINDGSLGIHNAAHTIQTLQGTYQALGRLFGKNKDGGAASATSFTYKTDYPNATLR